MNAQTEPDTSHRPARKAAQQSQARQTGPDGQRPRPAGRKAAATALAQRTYTVVLPYGWGTVRTPSPEHLAFYGGVLALGLFGVIDWPVALAIGIGHVLADDHQHKVLARFGSALEEA
jgi:hypothetical protein